MQQDKRYDHMTPAKGSFWPGRVPYIFSRRCSQSSLHVFLELARANISSHKRAPALLIVVSLLSDAFPNMASTLPGFTLSGRWNLTRVIPLTVLLAVQSWAAIWIIGTIVSLCDATGRAETNISPEGC